MALDVPEGVASSSADQEAPAAAHASVPLMKATGLHAAANLGEAGGHSRPCRPPDHLKRRVRSARRRSGGRFWRRGTGCHD